MPKKQAWCKTFAIDTSPEGLSRPGYLFFKQCARSSPHSTRLPSTLLGSLLIATQLLLNACGGGAAGGGGQQGPPPGPPPSFALVLSGSTLALSAGTSGTITVSVNGANGFNSTVGVSLSNLPAGVTYSPSNINITPSQPQQVSLTAPPYMSASTSAVTVGGTSGLLSSNASLTLQIGAYAGDVSLTRTRYVRTDSAYP